MSYPEIKEHDDHQDGGLQQDLETMARRARERRQVLGWIAGSGAAAVLVACGGGGSSGGSSSGGSSSSSSSSTSSSSSSASSSSSSSSSWSSSSGSGTCVVDPTETNGPYPADGTNSVNGSIVNVLDDDGIVRSDITTSYGDYSGTAAGLPLTLTITLVDVSDGCTPLEGYAIYVWHCTRDGTYSLYSSGVQNQNYLRGVQVTDSNGQVTFTTIFPACYDGRWPHIHFEVYSSLSGATSASSGSRKLTSQFAMDSDVCDAVYAGVSGYSASVTNKSRVSLSSDNVFGDNTAAQIAAMTPAFSGNTTDGYTATVTVGLA